MPECDRPFKCYCNENSFALKVANTSKIKIFEAQLCSKSKNRKKNVIRTIFKSIRKMFKKEGVKSIVASKSNEKTAPNLLIVNENVIII